MEENKIENALLAGEQAASKLRLWPCVHNFMNTHTLSNHCSGYSQLCVHPLHPHAMVKRKPSSSCCHPTPPFLLFSWMLPLLKHWSLLVSVLPCTQVALLISYSSTKRRTCHMTCTCVCSSLPFPEADSSANYSIPGPLEAHWMNERDCHKSVPCISGKSLCQVW